MVIFHSCVSLPEGIDPKMAISSRFLAILVPVLDPRMPLACLSSGLIPLHSPHGKDKASEYWNQAIRI